MVYNSIVWYVVSNIIFLFSPGPIRKEYLDKLLDYLFPDSSPERGPSDLSYPEEFTSLGCHSEEGLVSHLQVPLSGVKSSPVDGFLWRLTVALSHTLHLLGKSQFHFLWPLNDGSIFFTI